MLFLTGDVVTLAAMPATAVVPVTVASSIVKLLALPTPAKPPTLFVPETVI